MMLTANPGTTIKQVARNCYLVEFIDAADLHTVQAREPWTFQGDVVAFKQVNGPLDLDPNHIDHVSLWV